MGYTPIMRSGSCGYIVTNYKNILVWLISCIELKPLDKTSQERIGLYGFIVKKQTLNDCVMN